MPGKPASMYVTTFLALGAGSDPLWLCTRDYPEKGGMQMPGRIGPASRRFSMRNTRLIMVRHRYPTLALEMRHMADRDNLPLAEIKRKHLRIDSGHLKQLPFEIQDAETSPVPAYIPLSQPGAFLYFGALSPVDPELLRGTGWPGAPKHRRRVHAAGTVVMAVAVDAQKADHYREVTEDKPGGFSGEVRRLLDDEYPTARKTRTPKS